MTHSISTKGTYRVRTATVTPRGALWFERPMVDHPEYGHLEALLVPERGIQVCRFTRHVGRDWFDWYIDIAEVHHSGAVWTATDLHADVLVREGVAYRVVDLDEMAQAASAGEMSPHQLVHALKSLQGLCDSLNSQNFFLPWLPAELRGRSRLSGDSN